MAMTPAERKAKQRADARKRGLCPICCQRKPYPLGYVTCVECRQIAIEDQATRRAAVAKPKAKRKH